MGLISIVAMKIANQISRPIRAMADAAKKITEGDYSQQVEDQLG